MRISTELAVYTDRDILSFHGLLNTFPSPLGKSNWLNMAANLYDAALSHGCRRDQLMFHSGQIYLHIFIGYISVYIN